MKPERWQQIDSILKSALELPSEERAAYLDKACARDKELRREVESLIGHEQATGFLETQAFEDAARLLARDTSHALVGETLGSYKILSALGAGGMGEVYLALHIRTNRRVALKLLPAHFNADELRVRRFQQEARAVLALNHPNIVTVYDIEQAGETYLIATELVEGETLRRRMGHEPLTLTESLDVAIQLTGALAAAHEAGIVHRDIKPENIMLRTDGYVKVLDFGLAKLLQRDGLGTDSELPTRAMVNTDPGMVMGTVNYMSPEQARGLSVDTRTDIWSLGAVLYEMVTGRTPFAGDTASDVMALILQKEPPPLVRYWSEAPEALEWIVTKTLTKERDERYQTAKELLTDLKRLKRRFEYEAEAERASIPSVNAASVSSSHQATADKTVARPITSTVETAAPRSASSTESIVGEIKRYKYLVIFALLGIVFVTAGLIMGLRYLRREQPVIKTAEPPPFSKMKVTRLTTSGNASHAAISPDGKYVVHVLGDVGQQSLWVRHVATSSNVQVVPPDKGIYVGLTFSHDGSYIYYLKNNYQEGILFQVPVLGGAPRKLAANVDTVVTLSPDGKQMAFIRGDPIKSEGHVIVANTDGSGERKLVTHHIYDMFPASSVQAWGPAWSPDSEHIAFAQKISEQGVNYWRVMLVRVKDGTETLLTPQRWTSIGSLAWLRDGSGLVMAASDDSAALVRQLWQVPYPGGETRRITNDSNNYFGLSLTADSSTLVTVQTEQRASLWVAPNAEASRATSFPSDKKDGIEGLAWTPDGRVVYTSMVSGKRDIWIMDADGKNQKQLTINAGSNWRPNVSPDGRYIVFASNRAGDYHIWRMNLDGSNPKQLTNGKTESFPSCSLDNQWVIYTSLATGEPRLRKVSIEGGDPVQLTDYSVSRPLISPDGKQIGVVFIDEQVTPTRRRAGVIPVEGGELSHKFDLPITTQQIIRWTPDSRALTYIDTQAGVSNIWGQPLDGGAPKQLTDFKSELIFWYEWSREGRQLLLSRGTVTSDVMFISDFK